MRPKTNYSYIAGHSLERLSALSDGIFAVAMTLLVLDLTVPAVEAAHGQQPLWVNGAIQSEQILWDALVKLSPRLLTYFMSFLTLGIFWLGQQTQLNYFARSNRNLAWIHLSFLFAVALLPFSTRLLADFIDYRLALIVYWLNLLLLGVVLFGSWRYARRAGLMKDEATAEIRSATDRRIVIYQALYAFSASLCVINTYVSIVFIILLQLNSAIAPRIPLLDRF
ncbi:MAG: TMEM175 family protein [Chloroflexia bacterium]